MGCRTARLVPGGGAVSDGTDLRELLSVSGWYRRPSAITGWPGSVTWCIPEHSQHGTSISKVLKDFVHDRVEVLHVSHFERTPPMLSFCHFFEPARQAYQGDSSSWRTLTIVKVDKLNSKLYTYT